MKGIWGGAALVVFLLGVQSSSALGLGGGRILSVSWAALGLFWLCLWARPWEALVVGWLCGWMIEMASAAPLGMHAATTAGMTYAAVATRRWVRHDAFLPVFLFVNLFLAALVAVQGFWVWIASDAGALTILKLGSGVILASAVGAAPLVWICQRTAGPWMEAGEEETFTP